MNVDGAQRALKSWLEIVSGCPAVMENEPRPALIRIKGFWVVSPPDRITPIGEDYLTFVEGAATVIGRREFTCVIKYVCRDQNANKNARYWLEQIRMSLKRPVVLDHFRTHEIGIVRLAPTVSYDAPHDGRVESIAAAELRCACAVRDVHGTEDVGVIDTVEIASDFDGSGPDFTDVVSGV